MTLYEFLQVLSHKSGELAILAFSLKHQIIGSQASEVVVISNDTALRRGETVLLACVGFGEPDVEISWSLNGAPVVNISIYEEDVVQGERIFKQSFLRICGLVEADAGGYTCIVSDGFTTANATTQLTVTS